VEQQDRIAGQMDVFDCIKVAAHGSDGKPPVTDGATATNPKGRTMATAEKVRKKKPKGGELTVAEKVNAMRRAQAVANGDVRIPQRCPKCESESIRDSRENANEALCLQCGRTTSWTPIRKDRQARVAHYLRTGETIIERKARA
jgi:hypothetical protein